MRYMLGEIQYGGRVTDDFDKRLLNTFCKLWLGEHMFQPNFAFFKPDQKKQQQLELIIDYHIPAVLKIEEFLDYIEQLPMFDTPEVFGLHPNADIT